VPLIVISLFLSYILVYFSIWKGVESSGKVVYFTALLPYALLIIMLLRGLTLEGSSSGLYYLFYPDWSKLGNIKVWRDGVNQVIFSSGIAFGPLVYYSSCR
jgi:SNF family Na+-dependent transporter